MLDWTAKEFSPGLLEDSILLVSTHLVPSNTALPATGMPYELAVQRSVEMAWNKVVRMTGERRVRRVIVFDDGGYLLSSVPWERLRGTQVSGFEQTTSGIKRLCNSTITAPPVINVAGCRSKRNIEAQFIGKGIGNRLYRLDIPSSVRIGLVGAGAIGRAIADSLATPPSIYDIAQPRLPQPGLRDRLASSLDALLQDNDVIIGTSGTDWVKRVALERVHGDKTLISTSSSDEEFQTLLNMAGFPDTGFGPVNIRVHDSLTMTILNGGFPINFDRVEEWEQVEDIQLTRSLLFLGFVQSLRYGVPDHIGKVIGLDPIAEQRVLEAYLRFKAGMAG